MASLLWAWLVAADYATENPGGWQLVPGRRFGVIMRAMDFIDLKALMTSGRQCGVVVFAAGFVHGFTTPGAVAVAVALVLVGAVIIFVSSIKPRRQT
ncbi:MAG: hypothetical protein OXU94_03205 [Gammaproteobacteria bacterium]|nr:hypothetical protein [Gammaproteobacteria bacterium]